MKKMRYNPEELDPRLKIDPELMFGDVQLTQGGSQLSVGRNVIGCVERVSEEIRNNIDRYSLLVDASELDGLSGRADNAANSIRFIRLATTADISRIVLPLDVFRDAVDQFSPLVLDYYDGEPEPYRDKLERSSRLGKAMLALTHVSNRLVTRYHPAVRNARLLQGIGNAIDWEKVQKRVDARFSSGEGGTTQVASPEAIAAETPDEDYIVF